MSKRGFRNRFSTLQSLRLLLAVIRQITVGPQHVLVKPACFGSLINFLPQFRQRAYRKVALFIMALGR